MRPEWVDSIHVQSRLANIPFFFQQWGGVRKDITGRALHGRTYDEMPDSRLTEASSLLPIYAAESPTAILNTVPLGSIICRSSR